MNTVAELTVGQSAIVTRPRTLCGVHGWSGVAHPPIALAGAAGAYFDQLLIRKDVNAIEHLAPEYHQHNPAIPSGTAGLPETFTAFFQQFPQP